MPDRTAALDYRYFLPKRSRQLAGALQRMAERMRAFEAPAGSFIVMEGRLWHTSGANVTSAERRRMMFAYYSSDFVRQQMNWALLLPPEVQAAMDAETKQLFGIAELGNARIGSQIVMRS